MIGETANATDDLRQKYTLTANLRAEAARKGITDEQEFQKVYGGEIEAIDKVIDKQRELITQRDMMMSRTNAAVAQTKYDAGNVGALADLRRTQGAALSAIGAKTPQQLADAARARVLAEPVDPGKESQEVRQYRASAAAALAYAQAEDQLKEAQKNRSLNLEKMLTDQRNEADLIGKTGGAAAALRKEYELASAAKLEAAQRGAEVDSAELANIKAKAAELGKLTDAYNQQKFTFDLNQQNSDARLSPRDQQITTQLRQAGLPEDLNGANAKAAGQSIDWSANKAATKSFLSDFEQNLVNNGGKIGKSFADSLKTALMAETSKLWDGIFDKLGNVVADWLTGKSGSGASGSGAGLGAIGAIGGKLFGGATAANDNKAVSGTGGALGFVGNYKSGVDPRLTDILSTAATKFPGFKVDAMSGLRAGDPRFHGKGLATDISLTDLASGSKLANYQDPSTFGTYEKFAQTARSVQLDKYPELASDFRWGGYFGGGKGKYGAMDQMHFDLGGSKVGMGGGSWDKGLNSGQSALWGGVQSKGMTDAAKAIDKLTASSTDASKGLGQLGQLSTSFFPSAPSSGGASGGGIGGWFSSLFGGAFKPIGGQAAKAASGSITGLFAGGTNYAPGGMAIVGEQGPELVDLNAGDRVINNNSMRNMMGSGGGNSHVTVGVEVDNNGNLTAHVKSIVHAEAPGIAQNAARQTVGDYDKHQVRGGFGDNNRQYASRKG
ncbi:hypothetical protein LAV84_05050 [Rhizobium sp. VS19-DR104.2]|uniref:hypothetical protein n=1 Tax=unclassified Rhizobium TaxID=2613769 RepID=UPI001CC43EFD|nr:MULTISPECIES: hypothetical protein [unclassified Rhizobium]MBZ5757949.1 hypothetical protein [Rhizobium sp. VS19-DR96]MBZ5765221.1 hypothetical protein [Rhizobium sp. VS19-DR129.2]MBZ5772764.1 hypothetical protein [Rhizobium sp. VS19-DRK62.2]MBZ5782549.1 hypothetical protein [Rhizobium sp. VS19-DR121]MBZ5799997.1 hypothetical protein [Rhizobium sp. VS19-DR181]